jgi:hypothetical protein
VARLKLFEMAIRLKIHTDPNCAENRETPLDITVGLSWVFTKRDGTKMQSLGSPSFSSKGLKYF